MIFSDYLRSRSSRPSSNDTICLDDGIIELVAEDITLPEKMVALPIEGVSIEPRLHRNYKSYQKACIRADIEPVEYDDWLYSVRYNGVRTIGSVE